MGRCSSASILVDTETIANNETKIASFLFDDHGELAKVEDLVKNDVIENQLTPFNGTFIPAAIIREIGFVKKEMFIWGDEQEYQNRVIKFGYDVKTITQAKHYHPVNKKKPIPKLSSL